MSNYRRFWIRGGTYFFTVVTRERISILTDKHVRETLKEAIQKVKDRHPFEIISWVLLPDHLHMVWTLPGDDDKFALRWMLIKSAVTKQLHKSGEYQGSIWQRRYWEHLIRDEVDLKNHVDYIHFNPVKHGLCKKAHEWQWSTFNKFVDLGEYQKNWDIEENHIIRKLDFE